MEANRAKTSSLIHNNLQIFFILYKKKRIFFLLSLYTDTHSSENNIYTYNSKIAIDWIQWFENLGYSASKKISIFLLECY